jgi:hypothetical protein
VSNLELVQSSVSIRLQIYVRSVCRWIFTCLISCLHMPIPFVSIAKYPLFTTTVFWSFGSVL